MESSTLDDTSGGTVPNDAIVQPGPYLGFCNHGGEGHLIVGVFGALTRDR